MKKEQRRHFFKRSGLIESGAIAPRTRFGSGWAKGSFLSAWQMGCMSLPSSHAAVALFAPLSGRNLFGRCPSCSLALLAGAVGRRPISTFFKPEHAAVLSLCQPLAAWLGFSGVVALLAQHRSGFLARGGFG